MNVIIFVLAVCITRINSQCPDCTGPSGTISTTAGLAVQTVSPASTSFQEGIPLVFEYTQTSAGTNQALAALTLADSLNNPIATVVITSTRVTIQRSSDNLDIEAELPTGKSPVLDTGKGYWVKKEKGVFTFGTGCNPNQNELFTVIWPEVPGEAAIASIMVATTNVNADWCFASSTYNMAQVQTTGGNANGAPCQFPFEDPIGCKHYECTNNRHNTFWCWTNNAGKWGNCGLDASGKPIPNAIPTPVPVTTKKCVTSVSVAGASCHFPFQYNGCDFYECETTWRHGPWCFIDDTNTQYGCC